MEAPSSGLRGWLETPPYLVVALLAALLFVKLQSIVPTLFEHDGYYHIKVAELIHRRGFLQSFPWAAFSLFRDHFGDKELLFHLFLVPFTGLGLIGGAKLATVLLDVAIVLLTYFLLRAHRVRFPGAWLLLFVSAASLFFWRMGMCRPHLGSILCVLTGLHLLARRRPIALALLSAIYALAYTASHVILILALLSAVVHRRFEKRLALELPLAALVGLASGFVLHPNFPHNLAIWKVQNIDFYRFAWLKDLLGLGTEIAPLSPAEFLSNHLLLLLVWGYVGVNAARGWRKLTWDASVFTLGAVAFGVMASRGARFTEYWVPLSIVALGLLARDLGLGFPSSERPGRRRLALAGAGVALVLSTAGNLGDVVTYLTALAPAKVAYDSSIQAMSAILAREAPGEVVFHSAWPDAPALFMFNDRSRYLDMLDPIFFYAEDPARYVAYRAIDEGGELPAALLPLAPPGTPTHYDVTQSIRTLFQARFVVARADHVGLIRALEQAPDAVLRYRSATHLLFELKRR